MTTEEKLNAIVAKCRTFLKIAKKRTPGRWGYRPTRWAGGSDSFKYGKENCPWINADGKSDVARVNPFGAYANGELMANAAFIAACAGQAEAMARSTIVHCEELLRILETQPWESEGYQWAKLHCADILAAWPEELL